MGWHWYNIYEVIDIDTGEVLTPPICKSYKTIEIEIKHEQKINGKYEKTTDGTNIGIRKRTRYVKNNGQRKLDL